MEVEVREAVQGDAIQMRTVHLASIEELGTQCYDDEQVAAWAHDRDPADYPIESAETRVVVAEQQDDVVGFGWLKPDADDYFQSTVDGEVTALYVHPSIARQGVGTRLYTELEDTAQQEGVGSLGLWASLPSVSFYDARGYQRVTEHTLEFDDGVEGTVVEMRKELARE